MGYSGELKPQFFSLAQPKFMASAGARYDFTEHVAGRAYFTYGGIKGDDSKENLQMQQRNLNFQSKLWEIELGAQYNILNLNDHWWTPYVFAGVGLYHFNPYTFDDTKTRYFLKPLSTEGQGFTSGVADYKLTQFSIPLGFGADYALDEDHRIGLEFGYRLTSTDYLDDVSNVYVDKTALEAARGAKAAELAYRGAGTYPAAGMVRGNSNDKDKYYYMAVTYTFRFWFDKYKYTSGIPSGKREKRVGCPSTRY